MTFNFMVAPDFPPHAFPGWYMLNTLLQRRSGIGLHLQMPADTREQAALLAADPPDLIYANPFDATALVREQGYRAFARPVGRADEMVIATRADSPLRVVEDLRPGARIAVTDNRDVRLIGLRLLEPADLADADLQWLHADSWPALARQLLAGDADAGFFLADAYHALSRLTRERLHVLVESRLCDISHVLLAHPRIDADLPVLRTALLGVGSASANPAGDAAVLDALGLPQGFEAMDDEDVEFMIDLMDTLLD